MSTVVPLDEARTKYAISTKYDEMGALKMQDMQRQNRKAQKRQTSELM